MMPVYSMHGSKVEIGAVMALSATDLLEAAFTAPLTNAKEIKEPETLGTLVDQWETEDFANVTDGRTRVIKVGRKGGVVELTFGLDGADAGQADLVAAAATRDNYAFRITLADKLSNAGGAKNSTRLFVGSVLAVQDDLSGKLAKRMATIQINSNIVATAPTAS